MKPFKKYAFQKARNVFNDQAESIEKWIEPTLASGAVLHVCPLVKDGVRAALHKKGPDFFFQVEGKDENLIKEYEHVSEDFKFYSSDFIVEGYIEKNDNFAMSDILFFDGEDLVDKGLTERLSILDKQFSDLSGYSTSILRSHTIESIEEFKKFTEANTDGFQAGIDTSLYSEGCPSGQWCAFGKGLIEVEEPTNSPEVAKIAKSRAKDWHGRIQKGVSGEFKIAKVGDKFHLSISPVMPQKRSLNYGLVFQPVDKTTIYKRQFQKGNQYEVCFQKLNRAAENLVDHGTFTVLKSTNNSTVIDFDGQCDVFKGIFNVDGSPKHNFPDSSDTQTDLVYNLSFSEEPAEVAKKFGQLTWLTGGDASVNKMVPIAKQDEEEERFVFGEVLIPEEVDAHGDIYSQGEVRFAAHFFMEKFGNTGLMHETFINEHAVIIETYVAPVAMKIEGRKIKKGTWLMAMRVINESLFEDIKAGRLTGFSIGGIATVQELRKLMSYP